MGALGLACAMGLYGSVLSLGVLPYSEVVLSDRFHSQTGRLLGLVLFVPVVLMLIGAWLFTSAEPGRPRDATQPRLRLFIRWILSVSFLLAVFGWLHLWLSPFLLTHLGIFTTVVVLLKVVGYIALVQYAGGIAQRIPSQQLASQLAVIKGGLAVLALMVVVPAILWLMLHMPWVDEYSGGALWGGMMLLNCAEALTIATISAWCLALNLVFRSRIRRLLGQPQ